MSTLTSLLGGGTPEANPAGSGQATDTTSLTSSSAATSGAKHAHHHHHGGGASGASFSDLLNAVTGQSSTPGITG
ncbi:MAG: hypothetical protein KGJ57_03400 [Sphingomonadales bacterium]|nr:hypothetical protein [Sphingomonadales bacterium]MDE2168455.1 hypothetical protein [Sphingomonadales bacterium]